LFPGKSIHLINKDYIDLPRFNIRDHPLKLGAVNNLAGISKFPINLLEVPTLAFGIGPDFGFLIIKANPFRRLFVRRNSQITYCPLSF
jgi:hypothetical protein